MRWRRAGEGAVGVAGPRVVVEERFHSHGHAVLHASLQVRDLHLLLVWPSQDELQHKNTNRVTQSVQQTEATEPDISDETSGRFPAVIVATKPDYLTRCPHNIQLRVRR